MWGDELEIENALRGDDIPKHVGRARVIAGIGILVAVALLAAAGLFLASMA